MINAATILFARRRRRSLAVWGGRSRLRSSSLPLDPIRGILSPVSAI